MSAHRKAIIIGASSGIGRELARLLAADGWELGLAARREPLLRELQQELGVDRTRVGVFDVSVPDVAEQGLAALLAALGGADQIIIAAGTGHVNFELSLEKELETIGVNVTGFTVLAVAAYHHFREKGGGHLVAISSLAALRGSAEAPSYNASKAYMSNFLDGLRKKAFSDGLPITITEVQPGLVDTAMAKGDGLFWVAPVRKAAEQIMAGIRRKASRVVVTRRWHLIGWLLRVLPDFLYYRL